MSIPAGDSFQAQLSAMFGDGTPDTGNQSADPMPTAPGTVGTPQPGIPGQAQPQQGSTEFVYADLPEDLRAHLDSHFEREFVQGHKAALQRSHQAQLDALNSQLATVDERARGLEVFQNNAVNWLQGYIREVTAGRHQPDERDVAQFLVAAQGAVNQAQNQAQMIQGEYQAAADKQRTAHEQQVAARSQVTLPDGSRQQVFDPQDTRITQAFGGFLSALRQAYQSIGTQQQGARELAAQQAFSNYSMILKDVENEGKFALLARVKAQRDGSIATRRDVQAQRGSQSYGVGAGGGALSFEHYMSMAATELGPDRARDNEAVVARAMTLERQALGLTSS